MTGRVVSIRHGAGPYDDRVAAFFAGRGVTVEERAPFKGQALGLPDGTVAACVIYGGPFNAFALDEHPFLREENRWLEGCMAEGIPLLGICQGAQQIAHLLGAEVGPQAGEPHDFGYYPIHPTEAGEGFLPDGLHVSQCHYHGFDLPGGAEHLAYSEAFANQAMRYGETTYAFQFHPEATRAGFRRWQEAPWAAYGKPGVQTREEQDALGAAYDQAQHDWFMAFLDVFFGPALAVRAA